jgi:hypothetical protein
MQGPSLASNPEIAPAILLTVAGLIGAGLFAAWVLSGEAFGRDTGDLVVLPRQLRRRKR